MCMNICVSASVCIFPALSYLCCYYSLDAFLIPKGDGKEWVWMRGEGEEVGGVRGGGIIRLYYINKIYQ